MRIINTAIINIKTQPETKIKAQAIAKELSLNLSSIINAYLTQLIKTKTVAFSVREEPTEYLLEMLKKSREEIKAGKVSQSFSKAKDAVEYLDKMIEDEKINRIDFSGPFVIFEALRTHSQLYGRVAQLAL